MTKLFLYSILFLSACTVKNEKEVGQPKTGTSSQTKAAPFNSFYEKFHKDSLFQMNRTLFPLPGFDSERHYSTLSVSDTTENTIEGEKINILWEKKYWKLNHLTVDSINFKIERFQSDSLVKEIIYIPDSDFKITRLFKLIDNEWYLVYYAE